MRIIEVKKCFDCPFRHTKVYDEIGDYWEWIACMKKKNKKIEDKVSTLKTDFPKWCPLKESK